MRWNDNNQETTWNPSDMYFPVWFVTLSIKRNKLLVRWFSKTQQDNSKNTLLPIIPLFIETFKIHSFTSCCILWLLRTTRNRQCKMNGKGLRNAHWIGFSNGLNWYILEGMKERIQIEKCKTSQEIRINRDSKETQEYYFPFNKLPGGIFNSLLLLFSRRYSAC